jgi:hypothetical protein
MERRLEMPKVKTVEKKIWDVEGFDVNFKQNGKNIRGDKQGMPQYRYERCAKNDMTVKKFIEARINPNYPGYDIEILDGQGNPFSGQTKLGTVRDCYMDDE